VNNPLHTACASQAARRPMNILFPSPLPSPLGRGRPFPRLVANRSAECAGRAFEETETPARCSLSPRERARVRGNTLLHAVRILPTDGNSLGRQASARCSMTLGFPSPLPSPLERGRPVHRLVANRSAECAGRAFEQVETLARRSLSPRERARVRGNGRLMPSRHKIISERCRPGE